MVLLYSLMEKKPIGNCNCFVSIGFYGMIEREVQRRELPKSERKGNKMNILYEDSDMLVCVKQPGMPVQSDRSLDLDLVNQLKNYLYGKDKKKEPYIGLVHRLDRPVGGVMVFGKTPQATRSLNRMIQNGQMKKKYLCVVTKELSEEVGREPKELRDYLKKDGRTNTSRVVGEKEPQAKLAILRYQVLAVKEGQSLVEVELLTGRHHQIRVQMAQHLGGLLGDTKYNQNGKGYGRDTGIALFSHELCLPHPKTGKQMTFSAKPQGLLWQEWA